jgi:ATP-dependent Clp endopeptidase proteolytic subunit ClpP
MKLLYKHRNQEEEEDDDEDEGDGFNLDMVGNDIFYSGDITPEGMHKMIIMLKKLELKTKNTITIYIRSGGGDLFAGVSAMDHIRNSKSKIVTVADGFCASAATLVLLGSKNRKIMKNAHILIHQLSSGTIGKYHDMKDELKNCDALMGTMKRIYKEDTKLTDEILKKLFKRDIYFSAEECIEWGIVKKMKK